MSSPLFCSIFENKHDNVPVTDLFGANFFESMHLHIVKSTGQYVVLKRVDLSILDIEVDLCMMEHDVDFSVRGCLILLGAF